MPKVYVINKGCHDLSDAKRFGELVYLSEGAINRYATSRIYREFVEVLQDSSPEDYILPTGLSIMSIIATSIMSRLHGQVNLLLYKSPRSKDESPFYVERRVMIDELLEREEENV